MLVLLTKIKTVHDLRDANAKNRESPDDPPPLLCRWLPALVTYPSQRHNNLSCQQWSPWRSRCLRPTRVSRWSRFQPPRISRAVTSSTPSPTARPSASRFRRERSAAARPSAHPSCLVAVAGERRRPRFPRGVGRMGFAIAAGSGAVTPRCGWQCKLCTSSARYRVLLQHPIRQLVD